jgi:predicted MPP superfamily phosphohydrolase
MLKILLIILILLAIFFVIVMIIDDHRFITREYTVTSGRIRQEHTFVFLTDMHGNIYGEDNAPVMEAIRQAHPEAVLIGGDMITASRAREGRSEWYRPFLSLMHRVTAVCPVFCVNGNHEIKVDDPLFAEDYGGAYEEYDAALRAEGIYTVRNNSMTIGELSGEAHRDNIRIYGMETEDELYRKFRRRRIDTDYVTAKLGTPDRAVFNIVVTHHPKDFDACAEWGCDLCVSGHIHGGLMRLPGIGGVVSPDPAFFPKYSGGRYEHLCADGRNAVLVLSCGLGAHSMPFRIFNPGEVSVIHLVPDDIRRGR